MWCHRRPEYDSKSQATFFCKTRGHKSGMVNLRIFSYALFQFWICLDLDFIEQQGFVDLFDDQMGNYFDNPLIVLVVSSGLFKWVFSGLLSPLWLQTEYLQGSPIIYSEATHRLTVYFQPDFTFLCFLPLLSCEID